MKYCKHCGSEIKEDAKFCPTCGKPVQEEPVLNIDPQKDQNPQQQDSQLQKKKNNKGCITVISILFLIAVIVALTAQDCSGGSSTKKTQTASDTNSRWFSGGNLHNATIAEWKSATHRNKLATCGDWLASTKWKGSLNSPADFEKLKVKAEMLLKAVDKTVEGETVEEMKVAEVAAAIITMSNDLSP
jgi:hypothetical protein